MKLRTMFITMVVSFVILSVLVPAKAYMTNTLQEPSDTIINEENFPDPVFQTYLTSFDDNKDNILQADEIKKIRSIQYFGDDQTGKIKSLQGIELLPNVIYLNVCHNDLTKMDLTANLQLEDLHCDYNQITSISTASKHLKNLTCSNNALTQLAVEQYAELESLNCSDNQLSELNITQNEQLNYLNCRNNHLASLALQNNKKLTNLDCRNNQIGALDLQNNLLLETIYCQNNALATLLLPQTTTLTTLYCSNNHINSMDISNLSELKKLSCNNNHLSELLMKNNTKLMTLECYDNNLKSLDLTDARTLDSIDCRNNQLTQLDISTNVKIQAVFAFNNSIEQVDTSNNKELVLICYAPLMIEMDTRKDFDYRDVPSLEQFLEPLYPELTMIEDDLHIDLEHHTISLDEDCNEGKLRIEAKESRMELCTFTFYYKDTQDSEYANYDKVDAALAKIPQNLNDYTDFSVIALLDAKKKVVRNLDATKQAEVDQMAKDIEDAIASLQLKSELTNINEVVMSDFTLPAYGETPDFKITLPEGAPYHFATAKELKKIRIKPDIYNNGILWGTDKGRMKPDDKFVDGVTYYARFILMANEGYGFLDVEDVTLDQNDDKLNQWLYSDSNIQIRTIEFTVRNPHLKPADYNKVDAAIKKAEALEKRNYVNFREVTTAVHKAKYDLNRNLDVSKQKEVDAYADRILAAIRKLQLKKANYQLVEQAINNIPGDVSIYTKASLDKLKQAQNNVKRDFDITKQAIVDQYAKDIQQAIEQLVVKDANYDLVNQAIEAIPKDLENYTQASVDSLNEAKNKVKRNLDITKQAMVDQYASDIKEVIKQLVVKDADYRKVDEAIAKAEALDKTKYKNYEIVEKAIASVERDKKISEQALVDEYAHKINEAIDQLDLKLIANPMLLIAFIGVALFAVLIIFVSRKVK